MNKLVIAVIVVLGAVFIWNNNTAMSAVCSSASVVQNQFPMHCTKARAASLFN
ncbi:hypothetical protein [Vibrio gallicus]|uniref:hypothetical protein n=1 Tax=Vibrio gallicus TaxID=190897 RepID=UPI0021C302CD|nr:hypothetical protein [Vibrio gallicus]